MSFLPPLVALYDLTAGQLEHLPIRLNPFQAMIASGVLIGLAHVLSILLDPKNGNYKNSAPRTFERSGDASKRAFAAHNNGLEAFPVFVPLRGSNNLLIHARSLLTRNDTSHLQVAGIFAALHAGVSADMISKLATLHVIARAAFTLWYIFVNTNEVTAAIRSGFWITAAYAAWRPIALAATKLG